MKKKMATKPSRADTDERVERSKRVVLAATYELQFYSTLKDSRSQVEADVRNAYLDLEAAASQVSVAQKNRDVTQQNLELTRQRFGAGVTDYVEVVQSQDAVASAELDYINSVFAHNVAKLSLARAIGDAPESLPQFLKAQSKP